MVGYQAEAIEHYFSGSRFDIQFRLQEPVDGTGSAALLGREFVGASDFLLTFGDTCAVRQSTSMPWNGWTVKQKLCWR